MGGAVCVSSRWDWRRGVSRQDVCLQPSLIGACWSNQQMQEQDPVMLVTMEMWREHLGLAQCRRAGTILPCVLSSLWQPDHKEGSNPLGGCALYKIKKRSTLGIEDRTINISVVTLQQIIDKTWPRPSGSPRFC